VMQMKDPEAISTELIKRANDAGGMDNTTVVIGRVEGSPSLGHRVKNFLQLNKQGTGEN
jgi:serine/threonine protein phosphatase PrpC